MSKYLAELKPIGSFFFGGERTQKDGDSEKNNIVSSNVFPQQTSILGMLRKKLLIDNGPYNKKFDYSPDERKKIKNLIGERSFENPDIEQEQDFKMIKKISPVLISYINSKSNNRKYLMPIPKDHKIHKDSNSEKNEYYTPLMIDLKCKVSYGDNNEVTYPINLPSNYNNKSGISNDFIILDKEKKIVKFEDIFSLESNIGINLRGVHKTDDNGLFRINRYRFNENPTYKDIKFSFTVEFDDKFDDNILTNKSIVNLGGEGSSFILELNKLNENYIHKIDIFSEEDLNNKIILLSDTFIKYDDYKEFCSYSIAIIHDFRCLSSKLNISNNKRYSNRFIRSEKKYSLLGRGTVLFAKDGKYKDLVDSIEKYKNMRNIGYNQIIKEKSNEKF